MSAPDYRCLHCGRPVDLADTNVGTDLLGGRIRAENLPGGGLIFRVAFPTKICVGPGDAR